MKRALVLIGVAALCLVGFLTVRGNMPFMAILGTSMEPTLHAGNLILIKDLPASDVKVGDIIVFSVPPIVQDAYNYPGVVAHRVIKINNENGNLSFRTKGDNTGEDPFTTRPQDLKGTVSSQVPYAGFPLLFFQSRQGMIFLAIALTLFALYLYTDELSHGKQVVHRGIFAPVIEENRHSAEVIAERVAVTEKKLDTTEKQIEVTQQALEKFAAAIELYAQHLASHTSAIQGLAEASHELKRGAAEQNRVLAHLMDAIETGKVAREVAPAAHPVEPAKAETKMQPKPVKPESQSHSTKPAAKEPGKKGTYPPGCYRSRTGSRV